jgi:N-acetylglucosamine kinase-like BadF-type ATPase
VIQAKYFVGIDAGSTCVKTAVINNGTVLGRRVARSGVVCSDTANRLLDELLDELDLARSRVGAVMADVYVPSTPSSTARSALPCWPANASPEDASSAARRCDTHIS